MSHFDCTDINNGLIDFIANSPTPFHAVEYLKGMLLSSGFMSLSEGEKWDLNGEGKYFVTRNDSSIIAFKLGKGSVAEKGIRMAGGHTDSPCFRLKPQADMQVKGHYQWAVEPYGGMLLSTWFDRDLSVAGRVVVLDEAGQMRSILVDFKRPIAIIPSLAIHLNRNANENATINKQRDVVPLVCQLEGRDGVNLHAILLEEIKRDYDGPAIKEILDHELLLYDVNPPRLIGLHGDYVAGARIDNLYSCYLAIRGLIDSDDGSYSLAVCNDHEECGSASTSGAGGTFLKDVLTRLSPLGEDFIRTMHHSSLISADNAHALHPNFMDKHDGNHAPIINKGPVVKINTNQRYATNAYSGGKFIALCKKLDIPFQKFVARSDLGCGSTIGPITATLLGIETIDIGLPTFGMHSIRELAGSLDAHWLYRILCAYYGDK